MKGLVPVQLDFETYYDDVYTLKKMTPEEYIRDPRFEILGVSAKPWGKEPKFFRGTHEEIRSQLAALPWQSIWLAGYNMMGFDSLIVTEYMGITPKFWGCSLAMIRQVDPQKDMRLEAVARRLGLPDKGTAVHDMKGKRAADMTEEDWEDYAEYCKHDSVLSELIFAVTLQKLHPKDVQAIHWFTKMFAQPRLLLDGPAYARMAEDLETERTRLLSHLGVDAPTLRSDKKFAELLRAEGIEPPTKISKRTGKEAFAFARTDKAMEELAAHPDDRVRLLVEARVKNKSSIEQSRVERFVGIAQRGKLPVPLRWGATQTGRAAGAGKINLQNLGRTKGVDSRTLPGSLIVTPVGLRTLKEVKENAVLDGEGGTHRTRDVHKFGLRDGIYVPPGHSIVVTDSSNIELRVAHTLAGQMDTVERLRDPDADLYSDFAADLYGYPVNKADTPKERQHGKVGMLQLQYQSGAPAFQNAARVMGGVELSMEECEYTVDLYRSRFPSIPQFWRTCVRAIRAMAAGERMVLDQWGLCTTEKNAIVLPRGRRLTYPRLRQEVDPDFGTQWVYNDPRTGATKKLYGGALTENICQALAGIIVLDQCLEIEKEYGKYTEPTQGVVLPVHDEAVTVVRSERASECLEFALKAMSTPPDWWPQLPVAAEGDIVQRYGSAK